jgi:NAD(P)-dependent dehydrogenase (short-subunit alcohol dehydrogenase family)
MHPEDDNALNTEERIWDLTMQVNLKGVWWGCKYAITAMRNNPTDESRGLHTGGNIINTASFVALMGAATPQLVCKCPDIPYHLYIVVQIVRHSVWTF